MALRVATGFHIVDALERGREIVLTRKGRIAGIAHMEGDAIGDSLIPGVLVGPGHGSLIEVEPIDDRVGIGLGKRYARPPGPHADISDSGGTTIPQAGFDIGHRGIHSAASPCSNCGRFMPAWPSRRSMPYDS